MLRDRLEAAEVVLKTAGLKGRPLIIALDKVYKSYTGKSALAMAEVEVSTDTVYSVEEIAEHFDVSPRVINGLLAEAGYQRKVDGEWVPTGPGEELGDFYDSDTLYWDEDILDIVKGLLND